ncbi:hypothetical protein GCM10010166_11180 [Couchioplanes caeruleus subsp. azureus]|nr:hypothetical protein GCM10010166_11180 [Couchioplanes caeruleus subsp. azureus]
MVGVDIESLLGPGNDSIVGASLGVALPLTVEKDILFNTLCQRRSDRLSDIMLGIKCVRKAECTCIRNVRLGPRGRTCGFRRGDLARRMRMAMNLQLADFRNESGQE